ncbi:fructose-bisphosphatase class III, partial [Staphylococcus warneri]
NSFGMQLVAHQEFNTKEKVLSDGTDELSVKRVVDEELTRKKIKDTNVGQELQSQIDILKILMHDRYLK